VIVFIGEGDGAHIRTIPASGTFRLVYKTRILIDGDLEVSLFSFDLIKFRTGDQIDVQVPADLDQFGRDDSHGTIVGGKGFVQFTHHPAYGGGFFNEVNIIAAVGEVQRSLHSGYSRADNHH
jgi:hypothetical protein